MKNIKGTQKEKLDMKIEKIIYNDTKWDSKGNTEFKQ